MILQLCTLEGDTFWEVPEMVLRDCLKMEDLKGREARLRKHLKPVQVHSISEVEAVLVLNGTEDEESWEELREALEVED